MIYDSMENFDRYAKLAPEAWRVMKDFLGTVGADTAGGRHKLQDDLIMADVNRYETRPLADCLVELHDRYIDVQVMVSGGETLYALPHDGLDVHMAMDPAKDAALFKFRDENTTRLELEAGRFAVFFPGEAHLTGNRAPAQPVLKVVFKLDRKLVAG